MYEVIFLLVLGFIWVLFASIQDLKQREVADWLSFSLIIFAIGFRFFWSLFSIDNNWTFFYQGLIGLGIFFILGNLFYYVRAFAGGDAKLMIALGAILPWSESFFVNYQIFIWFFVISSIVGSAYGFIWSIALAKKHFEAFKKEFKKHFKKYKKLIYSVFAFALVLMILGFYHFPFFLSGCLIFVLPYLYLFAKSVDESCMIKKVKSSDLTEGDWLYKDLKLGKKVIKAKWDGLNKKEISLIKQRKKFILIRTGIPFVPVFLVGYLILIYFWFFILN